MRWGLVILVSLIVACSQQPRFLPGSYRDTTVPITSSTRFDAARFAGTWLVIESFDETPLPVTVNRLTFAPTETGYSYVESGPPSDLDALVELSVPPELTIGAFGRLSFGADADPIWVLWVDEDHRTAVLGTPSGRFGRIINRTKSLRADRLQAARDVLAFNGYDISGLRRVTK